VFRDRAVCPCALRQRVVWFLAAAFIVLIAIAIKTNRR
jgi:hypothetical protein